MKFKCIECGRVLTKKEIRKLVLPSGQTITDINLPDSEYALICSECIDIQNKDRFVNAGGGVDPSTAEKEE